MRANFIKIPSKRRPSNAVLSQLLSPTAHPLRYAYAMNASKPHKIPSKRRLSNAVLSQLLSHCSPSSLYIYSPHLSNINHDPNKFSEPCFFELNSSINWQLECVKQRR